MIEPMRPERLEEIRAAAAQYHGTLLVRERPNSAIAHRAELLAEIKRITGLLVDAQEANQIMRDAAKRQREITRQLTHSPGACPTLCDNDCDAACHEEHEVSYKRTHQPPKNADIDTQTGCCARDGIDCAACMTGRCSECSECVHYEPSDDEDDAETEIRDWYDTHCAVTGELLDKPAHQQSTPGG